MEFYPFLNIMSFGALILIPVAVFQHYKSSVKHFQKILYMFKFSFVNFFLNQKNEAMFTKIFSSKCQGIQYIFFHVILVKICLFSGRYFCVQSLVQLISFHILLDGVGVLPLFSIVECECSSPNHCIGLLILSLSLVSASSRTHTCSLLSHCRVC